MKNFEINSFGIEKVTFQAELRHLSDEQAFFQIYFRSLQNLLIVREFRFNIA